MKKRNGILIGLILLIIAVIVIGVIYLYSKRVKKYDISKTVNIQGIEISDGKLVQNGSLTTYTSNIICTKKECDFKYIEITVYHEKEKYVLKGYVGKTLEKGKRAKLASSIDTKIASAKKVSYKVIKK